MVKAVFDTNILIDFLNAIPEAREELSRYDKKFISIVSWMEVMIGTDAQVEARTRAFLGNFTIIELQKDVATRAVELRKEYRMKLPDAIIWASADIESAILVTRNTKDFPDTMPGIRIPYTL